MPSPLGHALAGLTMGWAADPTPAASESGWKAAVTPFAVWGALLAALPDADLLVPVRLFHRTATHSLTATVLVFIMTAAVTGKVTGRAHWRLAVTLALAQATHLAMDWVGFDRNPPAGIQLLWPFSRHYFISGWDWFPPTAREQVSLAMIAINARAATFETLVVGPCALAAYLWRRRRRQA